MGYSGRHKEGSCSTPEKSKQLPPVNPIKGLTNYVTPYLQPSTVIKSRFS